MKNKEGKSKYETPRTPKEQFLRNILGIRPFEERLTDTRNYSNRVIEAKRADKLKDAQMRFDRAWLNGDEKGLAKAEADYEKSQGDSRTLWNSRRLADLEFNSTQSEEARRAGKPGTNLNTLQRYEEFTN